MKSIIQRIVRIGRCEHIQRNTRTSKSDTWPSSCSNGTTFTQKRSLETVNNLKLRFFLIVSLCSKSWQTTATLHHNETKQVKPNCINRIKWQIWIQSRLLQTNMLRLRFKMILPVTIDTPPPQKKRNNRTDSRRKFRRHTFLLPVCKRVNQSISIDRRISICRTKKIHLWS